MTTKQANYIRARFAALPAWEELKRLHPRFADAVRQLPDESGMDAVCQELRMVFEDAKAEALAATGMEG